MNARIVLSCFAVLLFFTACQKDERQADDILEDLLLRADKAGKQAFLLPKDGDYARIPQDPKNPITEAKFVLGQLLFHETGLAITPMNALGTGTYSCASCHHAKAGFQSGLKQGIGEGGEGFGVAGEARVKSGLYQEGQVDVQPIRSPSILNVAYQTNMLWNGQFGATGVNVGTEAAWTPETPKAKNHLGYEGVEIQAVAGLDVHRMKVTPELVDQLGYKGLFDQAFPDVAENVRYTNEFAGLAIAAYERCVMSNEAPFQKWLNGDRGAMSFTEKEGAILFFGKANCVSCHKGPALNEMAFYGYGMNDFQLGDPDIINLKPTATESLGRGGFTGNAEDNFKFKVPQLYNLRDARFYGHGASFETIYDVVKYKAKGVAENTRVPRSQLAAEFRPLILNEQEILQLTAFIENALYDPNVDKHVPDAIYSLNCFPNNDEISRSDNGCE